MGSLKSRLMTAVLIAATAASVPALANGYYRGGVYYRGGYYYGGPRVGVGIAIGGPYWGWGPGYYPPYYAYPPYYYYPPAVVTVPAAPPTYIEQGQSEAAPRAEAPAAGVWYFCPVSNGYYPYVRDCPGGWQTVPAQPPGTR